MKDFNKVFGIGMSKTGTKTLGECFEILGITPHKSYDAELKKMRRSGNGIEPILRIAEQYKSFEDSPWYRIYEELDQAFPNSKFILTTRKDSITHAKSSWAHGVKAGLRRGEPTRDYLERKMRVYQEHNAKILEYFRDRPDDLLVLCWESGDGWQKLCGFLGADIPEVPIPHENRGSYGSKKAVLQALQPLYVSMLGKRLRRRLSLATARLRSRVDP